MFIEIGFGTEKNEHLATFRNVCHFARYFRFQSRAKAAQQKCKQARQAAKTATARVEMARRLAAVKTELAALDEVRKKLGDAQAPIAIGTLKATDEPDARKALAEAKVASAALADEVARVRALVGDFDASATQELTQKLRSLDGAVTQAVKAQAKASEEIEVGAHVQRSVESL